MHRAKMARSAAFERSRLDDEALDEEDISAYEPDDDGAEADG